MIMRGRTRCRSPSKPSNSGTALRLSRQATGEEEGRDGNEMLRMKFAKLMLFYLFLKFRFTWGIIFYGISKDAAIYKTSTLRLCSGNLMINYH